MNRNIGTFDRSARILAAAPLAYIGWKAGRGKHTKTRALAWAAAGPGDRALVPLVIHESAQVVHDLDEIFLIAHHLLDVLVRSR